ncbi:hypothetical protein NDU88_002504 [Pleurodeles waltl]|uniref:Uncharacterized protein n=1 Tax=Pleurodeles waltl TaxID=8319 RepID=A0AAV7WLE6_PLEWA|nr:hypothetical protein NDU88_002504 [Pleurodeles waltl]
MVRSGDFYICDSSHFSEEGWGLEISGAGRRAARRPSRSVGADETAPTDRRGLPCAGRLGLECTGRLSPASRALSPMRPSIRSAPSRAPRVCAEPWRDQ